MGERLLAGGADLYEEFVWGDLYGRREAGSPSTGVHHANSPLLRQAQTELRNGMRLLYYYCPSFNNHFIALPTVPYYCYQQHHTILPSSRHPSSFLKKQRVESL